MQRDLITYASYVSNIYNKFFIKFVSCKKYWVFYLLSVIAIVKRLMYLLFLYALFNFRYLLALIISIPIFLRFMLKLVRRVYSLTFRMQNNKIIV